MLRIGPFSFDFPVVQAALAGYSDGPMRRIARRFGVPYAVRDVVLDKSLVMSPKARRILLKPLAADDHPIAGQLMGSEPAQFAEAAGLLLADGYDAIDINFGCPVKKVIGRKRGGYLLSEPAAAIEILKAVRGVVPRMVPLTLKMRRGMDDAARSESDFFRIFDVAFELGLDAITVHGRTVEQRYRGSSDWTFLARVKRHAGERTVLGSGDLFTAGDIRRMLEETGVDGVSVARGCIGNPWIYREARSLWVEGVLPEPPSVAEQGDVIREHRRLAVEEYGPMRATGIMRKFGIKYAELHPHAKAVRMAFVGVRDDDDWFAVLDEWYDPQRAWPPGRRRHGPGDLVAAGACEQ